MRISYDIPTSSGTRVVTGEYFEYEVGVVTVGFVLQDWKHYNEFRVVHWHSGLFISGFEGSTVDDAMEFLNTKFEKVSHRTFIDAAFAGDLLNCLDELDAYLFNIGILP